MKKLLAIIVAVALVLGMFTVASFADETVRENSYEGGLNIGVWFGNTDGRKNTRGVVFNAGADFVAFGIPQYWNSNGSNQPLVTYDFEIFNYATDYATSVAGTPVFKQTVNPEGDAEDGIRFDFGKTLPKGEYAVRFTVTSDQGYMVLPAVNAKYSNARIEYTDEVFGFYVDFVDAGSSNYFKKISTAGEEILETPVYPNGGGDGGPQNLQGGAIGIVVTVPEGYALRAVVGLNSPTWSNAGGGSDAQVEVFKWTGDYDESVDGDVLASAEIYDHPDNGNAVFTLNKDLPAGSYLLEFTAIGTMAIGFWSFATADDGQLVFVNGADAPFFPKTSLRLLVVDSSEEPTEEPETQGAAGPVVHGASFDSFFVNDVLNFGQGDGAASSKLDAVNRTVNAEDGSVQTITIRGWIGFEDQDIAQFGYKIGKNAPVFSDSFTEERGDIGAIQDPGNGGSHAQAFKIVVDVLNVYGSTKIVAVAKLADGTVVEIDESVPRNGEGTTPNTSFTFVGPADPNPETVPATGDATIAMFAVIVVLAMGAAVVFMKKRAF